MFGKLLKYDFRSMLKQFAFIWPAALVLAVINRFTLNGLDSSSAVGETTAGITMLVYVAILVAMFAVTMIFVIQRFFKGLLGDEGYLMHTLPVRPWELIGSKLLCAVATTLLSIVVAICSILFIVPWDGVNWGEVFGGLRYVLSHWNSHATHAFFFLLEFLLFLCVGTAEHHIGSRDIEDMDLLFDRMPRLPMWCSAVPTHRNSSDFAMAWNSTRKQAAHTASGVPTPAQAVMRPRFAMVE